MKNKEKYWFLICAHHLHMGIEHESTCFATAFPVAFTHHMKFTARYIFMMAVRVSNVRASVCLMRTFLGNLFLRLHISATDTAAQLTARLLCLQNTRNIIFREPTTFQAPFVCRSVLYIHCGKIHTLFSSFRLLIFVWLSQFFFLLFLFSLFIYLFFFLRRLFIGTFVRSQINTHIDRHLRVTNTQRSAPIYVSSTWRYL